MAFKMTTPFAVVVGSAIVGGCLLWSASMIDGAVQCAAYSSSNYGSWWANLVTSGELSKANYWAALRLSGCLRAPRE